jgi:hypothetical protein
MTVLASNALTWADLLTKQGADGKIGTVAEVLNQHNVVMRDAAFMVCNKGTEHETLVRSGLPDVAWSTVGGYTTPSKSQTRSQKFTTGFCRSMSQVPQDILDLSDDEAALRLSEAGPHLESMAQEFDYMFFNGNLGNDPLGFDGIAAYYNRLPVSTNNASNQVVGAGGVGSDNTSIYLIRHGEQQTSVIIPKGIPMGIDRIDHGTQRDTDGSGGVRFVQEEEFKLHGGVAIKDWRANSRIANIDVSAATAGSVDLMDYMVTAYHRARMPKHNFEIENAAFLGAKATWYMNSTLFEVLDKQSRNSTLHPSLQLSVREVQGEEVTTFRGLPIRVTDGITNTETPLT